MLNIIGSIFGAQSFIARSSSEDDCILLEDGTSFIVLEDDATSKIRLDGIAMWILTTGLWDDSGVWDSTSLWID